MKSLKGKIFILSGPSGSGKTTLYKQLLADPNFKGKIVKSISVTTRPPRPEEKNGRDYIFVSPKMFAYKAKRGMFLEHQKFFDNYYGTPKTSVVELLNKGMNVLLCIDVKGAKVMRRKFPHSKTIFVKAPSLEILKDRLNQRGSENAEDLQTRFERVKEELAEATNYDFVITNHTISQAYSELESFLLKEIVTS